MTPAPAPNTPKPASIPDGHAEREAAPLPVAECPNAPAGAAETGQARIARLEAMAALQIDMFDRSLRAQDGRIHSLQNSIAYQLGKALIEGFRSRRAVLALPGKLLALRQEARRRKAIAPDTLIPVLPPHEADAYLAAWLQGGMANVEAAIAARGLAADASAGVYAALCFHLRRRDIIAAAECARRAQALLPSPATARWLGIRLLDCGAISEGLAVLGTVPARILNKPQELARIESMRALLRLHEAKPELADRPSSQHAAAGQGELLYVAASSRPYHLSGYTMRTEAVVRALVAAGTPVTVMTRPGYPWDRSDAVIPPAADLETSEIAGVAYHHVRFPPVHLPLDIYIEYAASAIMRVAQERGVTAIHAASNHVNALPALVAARRLGLPFHYEMRGIWELSRTSKIPRFDETEAFALALELEGFVAGHADRLLVISPQLAAFAQEHWGLPAERIALMPNGVEPMPEDELPPRPAGDGLFRLAYAGSLVPYEGLDLLIEAVALLGRDGVRIEVEIIGDGESRSSLEALARKRGVQQQVRFSGRIAPAEARPRLARASLVCLPRRPDRVCEIVPPLKLCEAMALGVPVLAADLPAMRGEMEHDVNGFFFAAADVEDLARQIRRCRADPELMERIGAAARAHVGKHRTWQAVVAHARLNPMAERLSS